MRLTRYEIQRMDGSFFSPMFVCFLQGKDSPAGDEAYILAKPSLRNTDHWSTYQAEQTKISFLLFFVLLGAFWCLSKGFVSCFHARASADFPREAADFFKKASDQSDSKVQVPVPGIPDGVLHDSTLPDCRWTWGLVFFFCWIDLKRLLQELVKMHSLHGEAGRRHYGLV